LPVIKSARIIIRRFCQIVSETLNQDRMIPRIHAFRKSPATARTIEPKRTPRAVEVFIVQTARAAEGISTTSGSFSSKVFIS
jgi:hypothetical protein